MTASEMVSALASRGKYHFTTKEAAAALNSSSAAARSALRRLSAKGRIAMPYRGFHVIVPPEYRHIGCLPADQFIPQLMTFLGVPYYVGLLSSARSHGAGHQQPQVFQVMVPRNRPAISCGSIHVRFVARRNTKEIPTVQLNTPRGHISISSVEATAMDLVGYPQHAGGLGNVATVLSDLSESIEPDALAQVARLSPIPWAQRLGYLLDLVNAHAKTPALADYVKHVAKEITPLATGGGTENAKRDPRWKLLVNVAVEPEL